MGSPDGGDVAVAASIPGYLQLSKERWMGLVNTEFPECYQIIVVLVQETLKSVKMISEYKNIHWGR